MSRIANLKSQNVDKCQPRVGVRVEVIETANGYGLSFAVNENILKLIVVMVV